MIGEHVIDWNTCGTFAIGKPFVIFYWAKSMYLMILEAQKRFASLGDQSYFIYNLPEYSEILSRSKSHSQMEQT